MAAGRRPRWWRVRGMTSCVGRRSRGGPRAVTFRAQLGAAKPADVFVPILIATYISNLSRLPLVASIQKLNLWNRVVLAWLGSLTLAVAVLVWRFLHLTPDAAPQLAVGP